MSVLKFQVLVGRIPTYSLQGGEGMADTGAVVQFAAHVRPFKALT